jgi:hypothetical protein
MIVKSSGMAAGPLCQIMDSIAVSGVVAPPTSVMSSEKGGSAR